MTSRPALLGFVLSALAFVGPARGISAEFDVTVVDPLATWERALGEFEKVCQLLVDGKPAEAVARLDELARDLPLPYSTLALDASQQITQLPNVEAASRNFNYKYVDSIRPTTFSRICESLGSDEQADWFALAAANILPSPLPFGEERTRRQISAYKSASRTPEGMLQIALHTIREMTVPRDEQRREAWESKLLMHFPDNELAHSVVISSRAERATQSHRPEAALGLWEQLMRKFPGSLTALDAEYKRNQIWLDFGQREKAIEAARDFLGHVDQYLGSPSPAIRRTHHIWGAHETAVLLWEHHERQGDLGEAVKYARIAATKHRYRGFCGNDETGLMIQLRFADLLRRLGEPDEALAVANPLQDYQSPNAANVPAARARALVEQIRSEFPDVKEPARKRAEP